MAGTSSPNRQSPKLRQQTRTGHTPVAFNPSDEQPIPTPDWLTKVTAPLGRFAGDVKTGAGQWKQFGQNLGNAVQQGVQKVKDFMTE